MNKCPKRPYKDSYFPRNIQILCSFPAKSVKKYTRHLRETKSNYNVLQTKTSGKLGIVAELECIDSFDVAWDALKEGDIWKIYLYTNWTYKNDYAKD